MFHKRERLSVAVRTDVKRAPQMYDADFVSRPVLVDCAWWVELQSGVHFAHTVHL